MTNLTPDLHVLGTNKCFPLYYYENETKVNNISKLALDDYQNHYCDKSISRADIFYYVYGILHHREYKMLFNNSLKKYLPHIPLVPDLNHFSKISRIGEQLSELHINFDNIKIILPEARVSPLADVTEPIKNIKFIDNNIHDESTLAINGDIIYDRLPKVTYTLNGRTPL